MESAGDHPGAAFVNLEWPRVRFSGVSEKPVDLFPLFKDLLVLFSNKQSQLVTTQAPLFHMSVVASSRVPGARHLNTVQGTIFLCVFLKAFPLR